jgi:hypothetical protein
MKILSVAGKLFLSDTRTEEYMSYLIVDFRNFEKRA